MQELAVMKSYFAKVYKNMKTMTVTTFVLQQKLSLNNRNRLTNCRMRCKQSKESRTV